MLTTDDARALLDRVLAASPAPATEAVLTDLDQQLTRYGHERIVQNVARSTRRVDVRIQDGARVAAVALHRFDDAGIRAAYERARALLAISPEDPARPPILDAPQDYRQVDAFAESARDHDPKARAAFVHEVVEACRVDGLKVAGRYEVATQLEAYANSHGLFAAHPSSNAVVSATVSTPDGKSEGWSTRAHHDPEKLDLERIRKRAIEVAHLGTGAVSGEAGEVTVVLGPAAVSELLMFFARLGCGAQSHIEKRSYLRGELGAKVFGDNVHIKDDVTDPRLPGRPFDLEGVATRPVPLIDGGVAAGVCWDRQTAARAGRESTGHSPLQPSPVGPLPRNLIMEGTPGRSLDELIAGTRSGFFVRRFHYCNVANPMELAITGMTRSGVFEIREGMLARPFKNFRFTVSLLDIFQRIEDMSEAMRAEGALFGARIVAPALRIHGFQMSSTTEF